MEIKAEGLGKKYGKDWVFKNLNHSFGEKSLTALVGSNGSGKSTLLKVLSSFTLPTKGNLYFSENEQRLDADTIQLRINYVAPYLNLIEELTFSELLKFHSKFKDTMVDPDEIISVTNLPDNKPIAEFSSGMKQRVKLSLGFFFESEALFLDEPTTNLDSEGIKWFHDHLNTLIGKRLVIIASNIATEYAICDEILEIAKFK